MGNNGFTFAVKCSACEERFMIDQDKVNLTYRKKIDVKGRSIYLTYYDCPKCGKRHFAQADDDKSLEMLEVNKKQFIHNATLRVGGKKLRKKKVEQYKDSQKHLQGYRMTLMKELEGETVYDSETGMEYRLEFIV